MDSPQSAPSLALAAYSEDHIAGRRVVVFGNALSGLAETLLERGARLVHVYDEDPARVAEAAARSASPSISFAPLSPAGIAARDGAFDIGFVEEVAVFSDPAQLVTRLRRALSARGVGFVCTANADVSPLWQIARPTSTKGPLSYYDLYDLVATQFDEVRMVGQTPFAGYALADFSPDTESEFSIDTGFVPGGAEEPEIYVAVCSHFPVTIEPFCVVQMVAATLVGRDPRNAGSKASANVRGADASLTQVSELRTELAAERTAKAKLEQLLRDVNEELKRRDEWVTELESRAATADERADAAEAALERLAATPAPDSTPSANDETAVSAKALDHANEANSQTDELREINGRLAEREQILAEKTEQLTARTRELAQLEHRAAELSRELALAEHGKSSAEAARDEARARVAELEHQLAAHAASEHQIAELQTTITELRAQVTALRSDLQLAGEEIARAEQQLVEQGNTVRQLRADLANTERFAALLLAERDEAQDAAAEVAPPFEPEVASEVTVQSVVPPSVTDNEPFDEIPSLAGHALSEKADVELSPASTPGDERRALADARAREAELRAALRATQWTVEELEGRLAEKSNEQELLERLYRAENQLQRQATLIAQYEQGSELSPSVAD